MKILLVLAITVVAFNSQATSVELREVLECTATKSPTYVQVRQGGPNLYFVTVAPSKHATFSMTYYGRNVSRGPIDLYTAKNEEGIRLTLLVEKTANKSTGARQGTLTLSNERGSKAVVCTPPTSFADQK